MDNDFVWVLVFLFFCFLFFVHSVSVVVAASCRVQRVAA